MCKNSFELSIILTGSLANQAIGRISLRSYLPQERSSKFSSAKKKNRGGLLKWYYDQKIISFFLPILKACSLNTQLAKF